MTVNSRQGEPRPRQLRAGLGATRRGVLLGAGLAGLGGALAGCSTAAVPYGANESGVLPQDGSAASAMAMAPSTPRAVASPGGALKDGATKDSTTKDSTTKDGGTKDGGTKDSATKDSATKDSAAPREDRPDPAVTGTVLGAASEVPVGGGKIFAAARVVVTQPARGQYLGFSAVCTHVGCIVNQVVRGTIDCPCHGSEFKITNGAVVAGPAPSPLPRKQIKIVDGMIVLL